MKENVSVIKKNGALEPYNPEKITAAITKSASRVGHVFTDDEVFDVLEFVEKRIDRSGSRRVPVANMHNYVEAALDLVNPRVAKSYRDYRNWKEEWAKDFSDLFEKANKIMYIGDKENSNADSALVSTKRTLIYSELNKMLYKRTFLTEEESAMLKRGLIWVHDMNSRRDTMNCCLCDISAILDGGFEMGNIWYNEPKSLDTAFDVIGDVVLSAASQQYGGFTLPQIDEVLEKYALASYRRAAASFLRKVASVAGDGEAREVEKLAEYAEGASPGDVYDGDVDGELAKRYLDAASADAMQVVRRLFEQGFQGWEYKFNTVASSRGDYPFITVTFGLSRSVFGKMASIAALNVREGGQGKAGHKKPVLFPKLVFLYDEALHGPGGELEDVFEAGVSCSRKCMYPDWLSLTGEGYVPSMYKKYGLAVSPMGCRAFLSPYYVRGGQAGPADESDTPVFVGRFNIGAVSLNLPLIYLEAKHDGADFYELLDKVLGVVRGLHKRTYEYLAEMPASTNPLMYCWGGFYGGHLGFHDKIAPLLDSATASFGVTALNELQMAHNGKSLAEDGGFALEVMEHIRARVDEFKKEDGHLYAIYGTPAESLCGRQVEQIRSAYGVIPGVSDRPYVSNSFHCHVAEQISPVAKQDLEGRFWDLFNGGKIQYCRYPVSYNADAVKTLVRRAMGKGFYEGVNLSLAYCDDCGHEELEMDVCPVCGSSNLTKIDRMNGYLSYSRVHGDTRLNDAKMAEIADRVSM